MAICQTLGSVSTSSWLCFCQGQHLHSTYDLYLTMLHDTNLTSLQCRLLLATTQQIQHRLLWHWSRDIEVIQCVPPPTDCCCSQS